MRSTIDGAGRLVIPKAIRDSLGLLPGQPLELVVRGGHIEIEPATMSLQLVDKGGVAVARADERVQALTADQVREALEGTRR